MVTPSVPIGGILSRCLRHASVARIGLSPSSRLDAATCGLASRCRGCGQGWRRMIKQVLAPQSRCSTRSSGCSRAARTSTSSEIQPHGSTQGPRSRCAGYPPRQTCRSLATSAMATRARSGCSLPAGPGHRGGMLYLLPDGARPSCSCIRSGFAIRSPAAGFAARYRATREEIATRYADAEIVGPAEVRRPIGRGFTPWA